MKERARELFARLRASLTLGRVAFVLFAIPAVMYGGSKKGAAVKDFKVAESPDAVVCTWDEPSSSGVKVTSVWVERRIKGVSAAEWHKVGEAVGGGVKRIVIDGFTLDRDYEYRPRYTWVEEEGAE